MALVLKDRVKETTTSSGTGSISLAGPVQGYQSFSVIGDGNTTYYCIASVAEWEVGIGTYSGGVLSRDTVLASSANNTKVAFSAGTKDVFCTYAAGKMVSVDTMPIVATSIISPNNTVNVQSFTAQGASTNVDLALAPKGNGALLSMTPDNTTAGGNKRGAFAVDWQRETYFADYVASGDYSVVGGGFTSRASGAYSVVGGGYICSATGDYAAVAGGYGNLASGRWTFVAGSSNEASGDQAVIAGGASNIASGVYATISGGAANLASGGYSTVVGGTRGSTRGIVGYTAIPASNSPIQTKVGVSQSGVLVLGTETTNATSVVLRSNSSAASASNQLILANNSAVYVQGSVVAALTAGGGTKSWKFEAQVTRGATASSTRVSSIISNPFEESGTSTWSISIAADTTNGGLAVTVTGQASTTIRWVCRLETTEVSY